MIDSHCHLDRLDLSSHQNSLEHALNSARDKGVSGFLCIGIGFDNTEELIELQQQYTDVWLSMGVHPLDDNLATDKQQLLQWCSRPDVIAVGETGLDYHYQPETREAQIESFKLHLEVASELQKPIIIHTRAAQEDTLELIKDYQLSVHSSSANGSPVTGILHCFTESWEMAEEALSMGYYVSISGIVTFRNADNVRKVARKIPLDRLLIETDSPYLAPVPFRGKSNEPAYLPKVAECVANIRGISIDELIDATTENFHRLFPTTQTALKAAAG